MPTSQSNFLTIDANGKIVPEFPGGVRLPVDPAGGSTTAVRWIKSEDGALIAQISETRIGGASGNQLQINSSASDDGTGAAQMSLTAQPGNTGKIEVGVPGQFRTLLNNTGFSDYVQGGGVALSSFANWVGAGAQQNFNVPRIGKYMAIAQGSAFATVAGLVQGIIDFDTGSSGGLNFGLYFNNINVHMTMNFQMAIVTFPSTGVHTWRWFNTGGTPWTVDVNDFLNLVIVPIGS